MVFKDIPKSPSIGRNRKEGGREGGGAEAARKKQFL